MRQYSECAASQSSTSRPEVKGVKFPYQDGGLCRVLQEVGLNVQCWLLYYYLILPVITLDKTFLIG